MVTHIAMLVNCSHCATEFEKSPPRNALRFCSNECRFWHHVEKSSGCWEWRGVRSAAGYGYTSTRPKLLAHRFSWTLAHGAGPGDLFVCHRCDNPGCVRPDHLFLGTVRDNAADMRHKGRSAMGDRNGTRRRPDTIARGEGRAHAKLTETDVRRIRSAVAEGETTKAVADRYGVSFGLVAGIVRRERWAHVA